MPCASSWATRFLAAPRRRSPTVCNRSSRGWTTAWKTEKEKNDFLTGVPAIVEAIRSGKIRCKVYKKDKFHAKCYITHARQEVVGSFALVGSSNLTLPGITENIELNVQIAGTPVAVLQEWYEEHWNNAEDVTAEILQVIERHTRDYSPFEVYIRALHEFCRGHSLTANEWEAAGPERGGSHMYAVLDHYQKEGYHALMDIAKQFGGAFLCDGVGLGKTFIGLMVIERLVIHDGKRVALFVPKTARVDVWERELRKRLGHVGGTGAGVFSGLVVFNHTDLGLTEARRRLQASQGSGRCHRHRRGTPFPQSRQYGRGRWHDRPATGNCSTWWKALAARRTFTCSPPRR